MEATDPYRPPVWAISSDDAPLVVEMSDKLPTGPGFSVSHVVLVPGADQHVETGYSVAELHHCTYQWRAQCASWE